MAQTRTHTPHSDIVPRFMVRATIAFLLFVLGLVTLARVTDRPLEAMPAQTPIVTERAIILYGTPAGHARVEEADGALIVEYPAGKGGFVSTMERVLARERAKNGVDRTSPVILRMREGNHLSLYDPSTGWTAQLNGFGADNVRTFARLLDPTQQ
ncbi:MAG: photosynthetic complex assembly protein PuhC [Pseudomonadota bacterium]